MGVCPAFTRSFSYTYYANGLKKSFTAPDGTVYEYVYGSNNELREVRIPGLGSMTISEYQWNRPTTMRYPGGSKQEYEYDALIRLKHLTAKDPGGNALLDYVYEYDSRGNIVSKTTEHGTYSYGYDGASRLTSGDHPTLDDEAYSYDTVGNRRTVPGLIGTMRGQGYVPNGQAMGDGAFFTRRGSLTNSGGCFRIESMMNMI